MEALSITGSPFKIRLRDKCFGASELGGSGCNSRRDDAAALFQQLQLLRNENRKRWGETEPTNTNMDQKVEDMLHDFNIETEDEDSAKNESVKNPYTGRKPLKALTNSNGENRSNEVYGKKKQRLTEQKPVRSNATKSNDSCAVGSSNGENMNTQKQQPSDECSVKRPNDYCVSKLSIGISEPTYEVKNYGVMDHSTLFNFAPRQSEEPEYNLYEDSPTNSTLSLSSLLGGLSVIEECDEEAECNDNRDDASTEYVEFDRTSSNASFDDCSEAETGPLLKSDSFQGVCPDYYEDEEWKEDEKMMCRSNCFFSFVTNLFRSHKANQNCFVTHDSEI